MLLLLVLLVLLRGIAKGGVHEIRRVPVRRTVLLMMVLTRRVDSTHTDSNERFSSLLLRDEILLVSLFRRGRGRGRMILITLSIPILRVVLRRGRRGGGGSTAMGFGSSCDVRIGYRALAVVAPGGGGSCCLCCCGHSSSSLDHGLFHRLGAMSAMEFKVET